MLHITLFEVADIKFSNLCKVGQYRNMFKSIFFFFFFFFFFLVLGILGRRVKKWNSSSILFILHDLNSLWSRGTLSYLPVSTNKSCDDVLKRESATLYLFSIVKLRYFSNTKSCLNILVRHKSIRDIYFWIPPLVIDIEYSLLDYIKGYFDSKLLIPYKF